MTKLQKKIALPLDITLTSDMFISPIMRCEGYDPKTGQFEGSFKSKADYDSFLAQMLGLFKYDPVMKRTICNEHRVSAYERNSKFDVDALNRVKGALNWQQDPEIYAKLDNQIAHQTTVANQLEKVWESEWSKFQTLMIPGLLEGLQVNLGDQQPQFAKLMNQFKKMRDMKPTDPQVFVPLYTVLHARLMMDDLCEILADAAKINSIRTYGAVTLYLRYLHSSNSRQQRPIGLSQDLFLASCRVWPDDIVLKAFYDAFGTDRSEVQCDFSPVVACFNKAVSGMTSGNVENAIQQFACAQRYYLGNTRLYQYLSLCWILRGDFENGLKFAVTSRWLPEFPSLGPVGQWMLRALPKISTTVESPPRPMSSPITMLLSNLVRFERSLLGHCESTQSEAVLTLLDSCSDILKSCEPDNLPFVYFIIDRINKSCVSGWAVGATNREGFGKRIAAIMTFSHPEMMFPDESVVLPNAYASQIKLCKTDDGSAVYLKLDLRPEALPEVQSPNIRFLNNLSVDRECLKQLVIATCISSYQIFLGLIICPKIDELLPFDHFDPFNFPVNQKFWIEFCVKNSFNRASSDRLKARNLINDSTKKFHIDPSFFDWARTLLGENFVNNSSSLFDELVSGALNRIGQRAERKYVRLPQDKVGIGELFSFATNQFGWRQSESLKDWQTRLGQKIDLPPLVSSVLVGTNLPESETTFEQPPHSDFALTCLHEFLGIFLKMVDASVEKTEFINKGGDESGLSKPLSESESWVKLHINQWREALSKKSGDAIFKLAEVTSFRSELQTFFKTKQDKLNEIDTARSLQSAFSQSNLNQRILDLILRCSKDRNDVSHDIVVPTRQSAEYIQLVLWDIAMTQVFRQWLCDQGAHGLYRTDPDFTQLSTALMDIAITFHGPERHITGTAPDYPHFNAGVWVNRGKLVNCHIFFDKNQ